MDDISKFSSSDFFMTDDLKIWTSYKTAFSKMALEENFSELQTEACLRYAENLHRKNLPIIFDGKHFARMVGYEVETVFAASNAKEYFYKEYIIPKKDGRKRVITEPLPSLKEIQRWILDNILSKVPIHPCAKAYVQGMSIIDNARFHKGQTLVLKMDIRNFFPSISPRYINAIFKRLGYSPEVSKLLTELVTYKKGLPQGAPSSPTLSNIIMYKADKRVFGYARSKGLRYTRYADDLTVSGDFIKGEIISFIEMVIKETGFKTNIKKTNAIKQSAQQLVTGIVVNEKLQVSKETRKALRQEFHYIKTFGIDSHLAKKNITKANYIPHLIGIAHHILHINSNDKDAKEIINFFLPDKMILSPPRDP